MRFTRRRSVATAMVCACGHRTFTGLQYQGTPEDYDGVSEWICQACHRHYGRWTRRELGEGEIERRHGGER
jgi:hypothetical protein